MDIEIQKDIAREVLNKVKVTSPFAVVAGGAARDWFLGQAATDIDIYLNWLPDESKYVVMKELENKLGFCLRQIGKNNPNYHYDPNLVQALEGNYKGEIFQFMLLRSARVNVSDFALSISQAWWDGNKVYTTKDFDLSIEKGIIFKTGTLYANSKCYVDKILNRFYPAFLPIGKFE